MNVYKNASLTPKGREYLVGLKAASQTVGVSARTAGKWYRRYRKHGFAGLEDGSR